MQPDLPKTIYHYASLDRLWDIKREGKLKGRRLGTVHPDAYDRISVFCLESPNPVEWTKNVEFDWAWQKLRSQIGKLLLEIDIDGIQDEVEVVDWATMERHLQGPRDSFNRYAAEGDYVASKRSFPDFLGNRASTSLPELILPSPVPIDRVRVATEQLELDDLLSGGYLVGFRQDLLRQVARTPELAALHAAHQTWSARMKRAWQDFLCEQRIKRLRAAHRTN